MLIRKCDNCGREFGNGDTVYLIKRKKVKNVINYQKGTSNLEPLYKSEEAKTLAAAGFCADDPEREEEWCEYCAAAVNNALESMKQGEGK